MEKINVAKQQNSKKYCHKRAHMRLPISENTNLHPVSHFSSYFTVLVKLSPLAMEYFSLIHSFLVISANITINHVLLKSRYFALQFCCRQHCLSSTNLT